MLIVSYQEASLLRPAQQGVPRSFHALHVQHGALTRSTKCSGRKQNHRTRGAPMIVARASKAGTGTAILAAPFALGGGDVFVAGATGQIGARIVQELLQSGQKVVAGVASEAEGLALLDFAKRFEILKGADAGKVRLVEVDFADEDSIAAALPKRGRVVLVAGDTGVKGKAEAGLVGRVLAAAKESSASLLLLVAPYSSGGGGGFFGGGGPSRGPGGLPPPSKLEEEVAGSGLPFAILRTAKYDDNLSFGEGGLVLGPQGSLPAAVKVSKDQVAEAAAKLLQLAKEDVLVEAWTDPEAEPQAAEALLKQVLPKAVIGQEPAEAVEEEEEEEEEVAAPKSKSSSPLFLFGTPKLVPSKAAPQEPDAEEAPEAPKAVPRSIFGGGKLKAPVPPPGLLNLKPPQFGIPTKPRPPAKEEDEEEEEEEKPVKKPAQLLGGFGWGAPKKPAAEEDEEVKEVLKKPSPKPLFGFGAKPAKAEEVEEEEKPSPKPLFGFGAKTVKAEKEAEEPKKAAPKPLFGFGGKAKEKSEEEEKPAKQSLFGFGAKPAKAEKAEEAPARPGPFGTRKLQKEEAAPPQRKRPPSISKLPPQMLTIRGRAASPAGASPRPPRRGPAPQPKKAPPPPPVAKSVRGAAPPPPKKSTAGKKGEEKPAPKKGGFLQSLGIGQDTAFVDELE